MTAAPISQVSLANALDRWLDLAGISIERPWLLASFIFAALLMALLSRMFGVMNAPRRVVSAMVRVLLILLIGACVAGVGLVRTSDKLAAIAVVDASDSVRRFGALSGLDFSARIGDYLRRATASRGADDLLGVVVFDGRAIASVAPTSARLGDFSLEPPGAEGTDIESALRLARAIVPPDAAGRLVLLSDGNQTRGNAESAVREFASSTRPVPVEVVPLKYRLENEVYIANVDAPSQAPAESSVRLRVTLFSTGSTVGTLRVLSSDAREQQLHAQRIELGPGENVRTLEVPLGPGRVHRFRAVFEPQSGDDGKPLGDTLSENNAATAFTLTPGTGSVLVVEGSADNAEPSPLARTLEEDGLKIDTLAARLVPSDPLTLQNYDLIILENVGAEDLPEPTQRLLASAVREMGIGLIMVGGPNSFGAGGWRNTPLESVLPVLLDLPERLVEPEAAVVFILDNSGSMRRPVMGSSRSQQEIANQAAAMALGALDRRDLVGVIAFNSNYEVVQPLSPNTDPASTASNILSIGPGGGTNLAPALVEAGKQLDAVKAKNKNIIVLTDGVSQDRDSLPDIARSLAKRDIRLSSIAIGDDADVSSLEEMSRIGEGKFYQVVNPAVLPRIFMRAVKVIRSPLIREEPFQPVVLPSGSPATIGLGTPPELLGLCLTQPRPDPTVINAIVAPTGEPVLSHWRVELGQVAAFTSDAGHWAANWIDWPGYRRLWTQLARSIGRSQNASRYSARAEINSSELVIHAERNAGASDGAAALAATVFSPSGAQIPLRLSEIAPGVFEGRTRVADEGAYIAVVRPIIPGGSGASPPIITGASLFAGREWRDLASNDEWLASLARLSGSEVRSLDAERPHSLFDRAGLPPHRSRTPLWPVLLAWIPILFLLDVAVRRIAWDRWLVPRQESTIAVPGAISIRKPVPEGQDPPANSDSGYQGMQLSADDASRLAAAARDRRRAERIAASAPAPPPVALPTSSQNPEAAKAGGDSLLAAKRRARERFEENQP
ncbi:MAG: VWA domain-containing protein [Phycisphaerales bacterium]|nr:VWA domain-containing protein [Phycisphaerales bacterium]